MYTRKCDQIGLRFSRVLDDSVTHLITRAPPAKTAASESDQQIYHYSLEENSILTAKYYAAVERGIPIISMEFIDFALEQQQSNVMIKERILDFRIAPLYGINVSISGYLQDERLDVQQTCEAHGGLFSPNFSKGFTHLLAPKAGGIKYQHAILWRIPVVLKDWLYDSVKAGGCLPVDHYLVLVAGDEKNSRKANTIISATTSKPEVASVVTLDEKSIEIPDDCSPFLTNCNFYLGEDFTPSEIRLLKQIILAGQGTRHSDYSPTIISHFICKDPVTLNPR